ncbi:FCD domain-containing protein [Allorhizobium sp. BGMRC 0089]|uniref:FadR/GntR family transcriptional regulator n=1 Tax=Allorhizobium sonneratiae TaxID=2934936 RepID=UPI0020344721|nr:FCD domain-containing protein [Allorhizobium sonneratiae]MCM2293302.1 FCD domain-containing protein [Allorhizobium sonneratiae]
MTNATGDMARLRAYIEKLAEDGEKQLPPEPKLAELIDVSRGRLRTLLKKVEDEGVIWRHVGKGTFVGQRQIDPKSPEWTEGISLGDMMDARRVLEPQIAAQAAIAARPADLAALERCLSDLASTRSYTQWKLLDERLHRLIAEATHNSLLVLLYDTLRSQGRSGLDSRLNDVFGEDMAPHDTNAQHASIVAAIKSGNPDRAEEQMNSHLNYVRARLFGLR